MENLEQKLGLSSPNVFQYKTLKVDNGDTKSGKNATGEFVCKTKDEGGNFVREKFGKKLEGVVMLSRARLMSKYDPKATMPWWTPEFNPLESFDKVKMFVGSEQKAEMTYKEIKHNDKFVTLNPDGTKTNKFSYITVVYILLDSKTLKIEFTGRSQGNWIQYSSKMSKAKKSFLRQLTRLRIEENKEDGGYECKFTPGAKVEDNEEIRSKAVTLLGTISEKPKSIETEKPKEIEEPVVHLDEPVKDENVFGNEEDEVEPDEVTNKDTKPISLDDVDMDSIPF